jgi:hypothetical protein
MIFALIGLLVLVAFGLIWSILAPRSAEPATKPGVMPAWHSDSKQLRVEYHRSIDKSVSPPR